MQVEGRSDGQHPLAQTQRVGRPEGQRRQVIVAVDLQQGHIRSRILADELGIERPSVVELHAQFRGAVHNVVVGHHIAVLRDDDTRTARTGLTVLRTRTVVAVLLRNAEELEERVVAPPLRHLDLLDGLDIDHGLHRILCSVGQVGILVGLIGRKVSSQRRIAFHLAFDILHLGSPLSGPHAPSRQTACHCGNGNNTQNKKCLFHNKYGV